MIRPVCAPASAAAGEQPAGTAPAASAWLCLEQPGPWGARALTESHLDPAVGAALERAAEGAGARACLVRQPGRHADLHPETREVLLASTVPGRTWLLRAAVADPAVLLDLDWAALAGGDRTAVAAGLAARPGVESVSEWTDPVLLVCTNGTRDLCCAALGRPVAAEAARARPGLVREVTHTSGHRFAPTGVLLPYGTLHARLDADAAVRVLDAAVRGETVLAGHRGRSCWPPAGQVAELGVRERTGERALDALRVTPADPPTGGPVGSEDAGGPDSRRREADGREVSAWTVRHRDGSAWHVDVRREPSAVGRPESCRKPDTTLHRWSISLRSVP